MKSQSLARSISIGIVSASFIVGGAVYNRLPERVASHWDAAGEVNGYMGKFWGTFLMPLVLLGLLMLFLVIPKIDPKADNIAKFRGAFDGFGAIMLGVLFYIYALTLYINLGNVVDFSRLMVLPLATLSFAIGFLSARAEPNLTIGIRTPWTIASESVWRKTHAAAGKWFYAAGLITLLGFVWPKLAISLMLFSIIGVSTGLVAYSYYLFRQDQVSGKNSK